MKRNFTLVEILGVTVLISILAAIGIGGYMYAMESSKESASRAMIERINAGLNELNDRGLMKKTLGGDGKVAFVEIYFNDDPTADDRLKFGSNDDNEFSADELKDAYKFFARAISGDSIKGHINADKKLVDGWGNIILIRFPGKFNKGGFDIISPGSDGKFGENESGSGSDKPDDLKSDAFRDGGEWICDDIANF